MVWWTLALVALGWAPAAWGQSQPTEPHLSRTGASQGTRMLRPTRWSLLGAEVTNPTLTPVRRIVATSFDGDRFKQFATEVWVPARAKREVVQLIRLGEVADGVRSLPTTTLLIDASGPRESMRPPEPGLLAVDQRRPVVATLAEQDAYELVYTMMAGNGPVVGITAAAMPPLAAGLDTVDCIVVGRRQLNLSIPQREALRQWVINGGTLWIMLDACDPDFGPGLLGGDWPLHEVDRVNIVQATLESDRETYVWQGQEPVTLVRAISQQADVLCRAGDWPVAMRRHLGRGQLVVTTLGTAAWRKGEAIEETMDRLGGTWLRASNQAPVSSALLGELVREQIGYQIMSRRPVLVALVAFAAALVVSGLWLMRAGRLERLAWLSPLLAAVTLVAVLGMGYLHRREVPQTLASLQILEAAPQQGRASVFGMAGIYASGAGPLTAQSIIPPWPDAGTGMARNERLLLTDLDRWTWQELDLPQAVRLAEVRQVVRLPRDLQANLTLGPNGVEGQWLDGPWGLLEDAVIGSSAGMLAPRWNGKDRFEAGVGDTLMPGRYIVGTMNRLKSRRQTVYTQMVRSDGSIYDAQAFPVGLVMMGWLPTVSSGLQLAQEGVTHQDQTVVVLPVTVRRPAPGTRVLIPGALLPYQAVRGRSGMSASVLYDNTRRRWIGSMNTGQQVTLRFALPPSLAPFKVESAQLLVDLRAPGRKLEILDAGEQRVLGEVRDGDGRVRVPLTADPALQPDASGGIELFVRVSDHELVDNQPAWELQALQLELTGVAQ